MVQPFSALSILLLGLALLPVLSLPHAVVGLHTEEQKGIVTALLLGVSMILGAVALSRSSEWPALGRPAAVFAAIAFAVMGVLSAVLNALTLTKFFGSGFEVGTGGSLLLFAAAAVAGSFASAEQMRRHYTFFLYAVFGVVCLAIVLALFGEAGLALLPVLGSEPPFLLLAALLCAVVLQEGQIGRTRIFYLVAAAIFGLSFLVAYQFEAAVLGLILLLLFLFWKISLSPEPKKNISWAGVVAAVFFAALLVGGFKSPVSTSDEFRPSMSATLTIVAPYMQGSLQTALVGSGPDTFAPLWEKFGSTLTGVTPLDSSSDVREGRSTLVTWFVTLGLLGSLCYVLCYVLLLYTLGKNFLNPSVVATDSVFMLAALVALFGFGVSVIYTIGPILFLLSGAALGYCAAAVLSPKPAVAIGGGYRRYVIAVPLLVGGATGLMLGLAQLISGTLHERSAIAHKAERYITSYNFAMRAAALWPRSGYLRDAAYGALSANLEAAEHYDQKRPTADYLGRARLLAEAAVAQDPSSYKAVVMLGTVLGATADRTTAEAEREAFAEADAAFARAQEMAPRRPAVVVERAMLHLSFRKMESALYHLDYALTIDPTLSSALLYKEQLRLQSEFEAGRAPTLTPTDNDVSSE